MKNKLSVKARILKELNSMGGTASSEEIFSKVKAPKPQIYTALRGLRLNNTLSWADNVYTIATGATYVAPLQKPVVVKVTEDAPIQKAYHELEYEHSAMCVKYYDALAVVRYLEEKLAHAYSRKES